MSLTTVPISQDYLKRLGIVSQHFKRSKTQQIHQLIEDAEKIIKKESRKIEDAEKIIKIKESEK